MMINLFQQELKIPLILKHVKDLMGQVPTGRTKEEKDHRRAADPEAAVEQPRSRARGEGGSGAGP